MALRKIVAITGASAGIGRATQSADQVANAIARAVERPVPEVHPYVKSRGLVLLNALGPGFCDRFVQKFGRQTYGGS